VSYAGGVLPEVHLRQNRPEVTRQNQQLLAFPLGEPDRPGRVQGGRTERVRTLVAIVEYLAVDASPRYVPREGRTFCNVYAYDYCYLAGAYLPRVWWTDASLARLRQGGRVAVQANKTVREMTANRLFDWLRDVGEGFGWKRVFSETEVQVSANAGRVCVIVAQRSEIKKSGHIAMVVPESGGHKAMRDGAAVTAPLQSQAGAVSFRFGTPVTPWYAQAKFREFGFWTHA
jgi:hypothetical protein